jgi:hypothetical protein
MINRLKGIASLTLNRLSKQSKSRVPRTILSIHRDRSEHPQLSRLSSAAPDRHDPNDCRRRGAFPHWRRRSILRPRRWRAPDSHPRVVVRRGHQARRQLCLWAVSRRRWLSRSHATSRDRSSAIVGKHPRFVPAVARGSVAGTVSAGLLTVSRARRHSRLVRPSALAASLRRYENRNQKYYFGG